MVVAMFHGGKFDGRLRELREPMPLYKFPLRSTDWMSSSEDCVPITAELNTEDYRCICSDTGGTYHYIKT